MTLTKGFLAIAAVIAFALVGCNKSADDAAAAAAAAAKAMDSTAANLQAPAMTADSSGDYKSLIAKYMDLSKQSSDAVTKGDSAAVTKIATQMGALATDINAAITKLPAADQAKAAQEFSKAAGGF
jgi:hypothetical protein